MKKLNIVDILKKIKTERLKIFTVLDFQRLFAVNYQQAKRLINRYVQKKIFLKLRKGLYCLKENRPGDFEISNALCNPSYISFETALSFYGLIPETVYEITAATTRFSKSFVIENLKFSYRKLKKDYFFGYKTEKTKGGIILIAEPEKALLDTIYLFSFGKGNLPERIKLEKIDKNKLLSYAKRINSSRLLKIIYKIYDRD